MKELKFVTLRMPGNPDNFARLESTKVEVPPLEFGDFRIVQNVALAPDQMVFVSAKLPELNTLIERRLREALGDNLQNFTGKGHGRKETTDTK